MPAKQLHRGRGRFPHQVHVFRAVQNMLRQVDQEQPVLVVRRQDAVLRQPSENQKEAAVLQVQRALRQHGREQKVYRRRTSEFNSH